MMMLIDSMREDTPPSGLNKGYIKSVGPFTDVTLNGAERAVWFSLQYDSSGTLRDHYTFLDHKCCIEYSDYLARLLNSIHVK